MAAGANGAGGPARTPDLLVVLRRLAELAERADHDLDVAKALGRVGEIHGQTALRKIRTEAQDALRGAGR